MIKLSVKKTAYIGLLSALATVLMFFPHFPVLGAFPFLKIDFADVPALMAALTLHPLAGIVVELIKNLIHLSASGTAFVGELSNFIVGSVFTLAAGILSRGLCKNRLMKKKLRVTLPIAVIFLTIAAALSNYFIVGPLYFGSASEKIMEFVLYGVVPFNLIKGALQSIAFYFLYRGTAPLIQKRMYEYR